MSRPFTLTVDAETDVLSIWEYLADNESELLADDVVQRIYGECERLAKAPGIGQFRLNLLDKRYKFWRTMSYVIAYRLETDPLQIIAIVHGRRDLDALFADRSTD